MKFIWRKITVNEVKTIEEITKEDLLIFLTPWEWEFRTTINLLKKTHQRISKKQLTKYQEIESKLQEIELEIKSLSASLKVVNSTKKTRSINLGNFIYLSEKDPRFTILTDSQKKAIKKIKDYWKNRGKNARRWQSQKHWSHKKETISSRIDTQLFDQLKNYNVQKIIQNFVRMFLKNSTLRRHFIKNTLPEQFENEKPIMIWGGIDATDCYDNLINIYPKVVSGNVLNIEKELFTFYFTFKSAFSVSYAVRVALIHHRNESEREPIKRDEIIPILLDLIKDRETGV